MERLQNFRKYINEYMTDKITVGQSGTEVYETEQKYIAKYVRRDLLQSDEAWASYQREAQFYSSMASEQYRFLPRIYHCRRTEDEIEILMQRYHPISRADFDDTMLSKVMDVLVQIHAMPVPAFLPQTNTEPLQLDNDEICRCFRGWSEVIGEHGDIFSKETLIRISEKFNAINKQAYTAKNVCCHGDFHFDNLLLDGNGNIIVCDWQNVSRGHASGDISFFLSRLSADGVEISKEKAIRFYCQHTPADITPDEISVQMSLANLNTSFIHWHRYLHGSSAERVQEIWLKMIEDAELFCGMYF